MQFDQVTVIGGGLAGSECAIQLADRGFAVKLCEMRPQVSSPAHHTDHLAELVCSNSFKSTRPDSAAGLLKAELERMGSVLLDCAHRAAVPAGGALAVDRVKFSELVPISRSCTARSRRFPRVTWSLPRARCVHRR